MPTIPKPDEPGATTPLNAVRVFNMAAECGSFSAAARQLGIGQPAVSRQIANLEHWLGVSLFRRGTARTTLTRDGSRLFADSSKALQDLDSALFTLRRSNSDEFKLTVDVTVSFASLWLLDKLEDFTASYPEIDLRLVTRHEGFDVSTNADVVIHFGEPPTQATMIVPEHLVVIAGRDYQTGPTALGINGINEHPLLILDQPGHNDDWATLLGQPPSNLGPSYSNYTVYLQAIVAGQGLGIGWQHLITRHLASGSVRTVSNIECSTSRGYFAQVTTQGSDNDLAQAFTDWLVTSELNPD